MRDWLDALRPCFRASRDGRKRPRAVAPTRWPPPRRHVSELLWGNGYLFPGGDAEILRLAAPMRLGPGHSCLLLGGGLAGPARALATTGATVTRMVSDPALATDESALVWPPNDPEVASMRFDRVLALEPFGMGDADREGAIAFLAATIVPVGQVVLTEWVADGPTETELAEWVRLEGRARPAAAPEDVSRALRRVGFAVPAPADLSAHHAGLIREGWNRAMASLPRAPLPEAEAAALLEEEERWRARLALLASGRWRLLCWHGMGKAHVGPLASVCAGLTAATRPPR